MLERTHSLSIVLHDVAPSTWPLYRDFVQRVDALGSVPLTLLVVPDFHHRDHLARHPEFVAAMDRRLARGDELVMHGYYHADDGPPPRTPREYFMRRIYTHEGEMYRLPEAEVRARLDRGVALFQGFGWPLRGFVAPAWLLGPDARRVLQEYPFRYTSDPTALLRLPDFAALAAPSLVWSARSAWRRKASRLWNQRRIRTQRDAPLLRLGLHPVDMAYASSRRFWFDTLLSLLPTRRPITKSDWLEQMA